MKLLAAAACAAAVSVARAGEAEDASWLDDVNFRYLLKIQASVTQQEPSDSTLNPDNAILQLPAWAWNSQVRLDLNADYGPVSFFIKPRLVVERLEWEEGPQDGESESDEDSYINEWQLRVALAERLFASYGRENLQWGPAYLFSPSNPFIQENGQNNPKGEVPGLDYAKILWIPSGDWSVNLIANTGEGEAGLERDIDSEYNEFVGQVEDGAQEQIDFINEQYKKGLEKIDEARALAPGTRGPIARAINEEADRQEAAATQARDAAIEQVNSTTADIYEEANIARDTYNREFHRQYAVKVDYSSLQRYATLITSYKESDYDDEISRTRIGGYAGVTASDALLLYTEAAVTWRGEELYPVDDPESPLGMRLATTRVDEDDFRGSALAGGTYTFENGRTIVAEYLYNGVGYDKGEAEDYYDLREDADDALLEPDPLSTLGFITLAQAEDVGMRLIRRNYLLLQYQQIQMVGKLGFVLRCTIGLDDQSAQLIPIFNYNIGDRWQVFAIMSQNVGDDDTEFTSVYEHAYQFGLEVSF